MIEFDFLQYLLHYYRTNPLYNDEDGYFPKITCPEPTSSVLGLPSTQFDDSLHSSTMTGSIGTNIGHGLAYNTDQNANNIQRDVTEEKNINHKPGSRQSSSSGYDSTKDGDKTSNGRTTYFIYPVSQ